MNTLENIFRFTKRVTPYVFKRLLIFIPTLLIISFLSFLISVNAPGDPVAKIVTAMGQDGTASQNSDANEKTKQLVRKKLGLNKPVFYLSLGTLADCDTLYRIADKNRREAAEKLTRDIGDWDLVSNLHKDLKKPIFKIESQYPDSILSQKERAYKSQLVFHLNGLKDAASLDGLNNKYESVKIWADSIGGIDFKDLRSNILKINEGKSTWPKYIPKINFYGISNQYHIWLLGDIGLESNIDTIKNIVPRNGLLIFDEFTFINKNNNWIEFTSNLMTTDTIFKQSFESIPEIQFYNNGRWFEFEKSANSYNVFIDRGRKGVLRGDFGISFEDGIYVRDKIWSSVSVSFWLIFFSVLLSYIVSIPVGILSASRKGGRFDRASSVVLYSLYSLPSFFIATILLYTFANPDFFSWFPESGISDPEIFNENWSLWKKLEHQAPFFVLPLIAYTYSSFAFLSRIMRAGMIDVIEKDFVRTARAKGLTERNVLLKHVLKNSLIPIITVFANIFPAAVGGSVILESIFAIPGMGKLGYEAILNLDYPIIMAVFTVSGALTILGYIIADILYALVDPRISLNK